MKKATLFLVLIGICFAAGYQAAKVFDREEVFEEEITSGYLPAQFPVKSHPFTIVIIGRNNGATAAKTLSSVFSQAYANFRLIYIDDASDDGSFDLVCDLIHSSEHFVPVTVVQNEKRLGHLANLVRAVEDCADSEIVVVLDPRDWLAHEWVLQRLNAYYTDPDIWIATADYLNYPSFQRPELQSFHYLRFQPQSCLCLKTFYAKLFKLIEKTDLIHSDQYLLACSELAFMAPMLEMAKDHYFAIPEVLLIYNEEKPYIEDRDLQMQCEKFIRNLDPYSPLVTFQVTPCGE